jgi:hypothetical protein
VTSIETSAVYAGLGAVGRGLRRRPPEPSRPPYGQPDARPRARPAAFVRPREATDGLERDHGPRVATWPIWDTLHDPAAPCVALQRTAFLCTNRVPDEVRFGVGDHVADVIAANRADARAWRLAENRAPRCAVCCA